MGIQILDLLCDGHMDCNNMLASITGLSTICSFFLDGNIIEFCYTRHSGLSIIGGLY